MLASKMRANTTIKMNIEPARCNYWGGGVRNSSNCYYDDDVARSQSQMWHRFVQNQFPVSEFWGGHWIFVNMYILV